MLSAPQTETASRKTRRLEFPGVHQSATSDLQLRATNETRSANECSHVRLLETDVTRLLPRPSSAATVQTYRQSIYHNAVMENAHAIQGKLFFYTAFV